MKNFDFLRLDGQILRTFLTILEESSVSRAAERLGVTQSAVSHSLAKLRGILGDPLFVRSGQGLTPTETAIALKEPAQHVLDGMKTLTDKRPFDPKLEELNFIVAANDMQRDLIFPELVRAAHSDGIQLTLELKPSGVPSVSLLRDARCDLIISPLPPDAPDMIQQKLFSGRMMCFYDESCTRPPETLEEYLAAQHVDVQFVLGGKSSDVLRSSALPHPPEPTVTVSNFAGVTPFVQGTRMLATEIEQMKLATLRDLSMAPLPFDTEPLNVFMVWHERSQNDPAHRWLRNRVREICRDLVS